MGAAGSSNNQSPSAPSAPLQEQSEESACVCGNAEHHHREFANENPGQRAVFDLGEQPQSQGPSPYTSLRGDEWWNQRPTAPSLSNLRPSRQETLLTYAAQMTGWQPSDGRSPSFSHQQHETMELSRIVSQLAMANQQLASAHNTALLHLEALCAEFRRERDLRNQLSDRVFGEEVLANRLEDKDQEEEDDEEERRKTEARVSRLESLLAKSLATCRGKQKSSRREEERKLRARVERLENLLNVQRSEDRCRISCQFNEERPKGRRESSMGEVNDDRARTKVPEDEVKSEPSRSCAGTSDDAHSRSIVRIPGSPSEVVSGNDEKCCFHVKLHLERENSLSEEERDRVEAVANEEIIRLTEEIERLKADRLEYRNTNERLLDHLADQKRTIEQLNRDYEESKVKYEKVESSLNERRQQYDQLLQEFNSAKQETEMLLKKIDAFHLEKDTAEARISSLEQDLQKSLLEKEQIKSIESQKASKLRAQLSEEVSDKKKQIKALEDALDEIQRLKETIKTERKNSVSKEDIASIEEIDEPQESSSSDRAASMEEFKKELNLKREARQRAIAAVSSEMERLRRELDAEKEAHSETSRILDLLRSAQANSQTQTLTICPVAEGTRKSKMKEQKPDENEMVLKRIEAQRLTNILKVSDELRNDVRFQIEKVDDLRYQLESEPDHNRYRIRCLTEVTNKTREALCARERRANELKDHLAQILVRLGDRSFLDVKDDIGAECERQLENINSLKGLYNERLKVLTELKDAAVKELLDVKERLEHSLKKSENLEEDLRKAEEKIDAQDTEISNLESQLGLTKADCRDLQNQMSLINGLFTQMLLGASSADMDLDRLTQLLQENHDLISDMAREEGTEAAALPKLLLDLVEQVEGSKGTQKRAEGENTATTDPETDRKEDDLQEEDIAHNLPKVWRVLLELLSCHAVGTPSVTVTSDPNSCYKSVDTPAGPRLVISVSKTYIRLKELILEKKHLEKEMNRMKQLNAHLESKLGEQEKRLSEVSAELSKTWNIVGRMQAQHQQLHTHEKILRYELQQKRKMLQELKQELEYCREKWESARQKNTNTEIEWRSLRREFAARKALAAQDSFNNSAESGFSDERGDDTDEEDNAVEGRIRLGPRRRRKESPRAPTPDTESEQPTDTELSEPKASNSVTMEQRTPTPETETELDEIEIADTTLESESINVAECVSESLHEALDPLDQALTNVIQNLIKSDDDSSPKEESVETSQSCESEISSATEETSPKTENSFRASLEENSSSIEAKVFTDFTPEEKVPGLHNSTEQETTEDKRSLDGEKTKTEEPPPSVSHPPTVITTTATTTISTIPVFSIGPFPPFTVTSPSTKNVQFSEPLIVGPSNRSFAPVFGASINVETSSDNVTSTPDQECDNDKEKRAKSTEHANSDSISIDSSSSQETVKELPNESVPSSSSSVEDAKSDPQASSKDSPKSEECTSGLSASTSLVKEESKVSKARTPEEALAARADRLKRLEEQAEWLMKKMNATNRRGSALSTRLEELHEVYGEPPVPPPMPNVLPSRRLRTVIPDLPRQVPENSSPSEAAAQETYSTEKHNELPSDNAP